MAVSTTTTLSIGCNMFAGRLRQWEPYESKLFRKPINYFRWFCLNDHDLQRFRTETLNFNSRRVLLHSLHAYGQEADDAFLPNVSEDTDEMFDDLLKKYGKVVFRKNDRKSQSSELDDDAESLSYMTCWYEKKTSTCKDAVLAILFYLPRLRCECWKWVPDLTVVAVEMAKVASDVKAADIRVLFVKPLVYWTRFFIIATAFSRPQIDAIGSRIRDLAEKKYRKIPSGDTKPNSWTLLDFGDVVIHIFLPQQRAFYNLEEFYGNATLIELPSENQPPFRS